MPLLFRDLDVESMILRHVLAVGEIVRIHDGSDFSRLDGRFEDRHVNLS